MLTRRRQGFHGFPINRAGMGKVIFLFIGAILLVGHVGCAVPLLTASASGDTEEVVLLLQQGHHANEVFPLVGTRPLILAAASGHPETVKALLDAGADVNAEDVTGWTALHAGAFKGNASIVTLLLEHGAIPGKNRWFLRSPEYIAESLGHKDIVALLKKTAPPARDHVRSPPHNPSAP